MKTDWDYTHLAQSYLKRPDYAESVIDQLLTLCNAKPGDLVCDIGAGVRSSYPNAAQTRLKYFCH